jgi:hypothetical protein
MRTRLVLVAILLAGAVSAGPVFTITPSGDVSGAPGSTVGWGFTITNDTDYIEITSAQYCVNPVSFPLVCTPSGLGTFNDFISQFNDIIVGPPGGTDPTSVSQDFDPILMTGVGSFVIDPGASGGDAGQIVLTYNVTDLDPNDPNAVTLGTDLVLSANASVNVSTPEPGTAGLIFLALAGLGVARRRIYAPWAAQCRTPR